MRIGTSVVTMRGPDGETLTAEEWAALFADTARRWVLSTDLGGGQYLRTIWFGLTLPGMSDAFESAYIASDGAVTLLERYCDKGTAVAGHKRWVQRMGHLDSERGACERLDE
jgi:hypothetical protein